MKAVKALSLLVSVANASTHAVHQALAMSNWVEHMRRYIATEMGKWHDCHTQCHSTAWIGHWEVANTFHKQYMLLHTVSPAFPALAAFEVIRYPARPTPSLQREEI